MEIIEEEQQLGHVGQKARHMKISRRDTMVNDLKNSTAQGIISVISDVISLGVLLYGLYLSYQNGGQAGYLVGILMIVALLFAAGGILFAVLGFRNRKKIRHYNEIRGLAAGGILAGLLIALYVRGVILFFAG